MKKLLPLFIVGILVLSGLGAIAIANNKTNDLKIMTESIAISEPVVKDAGQYVTVSLEEAATSFIESDKPMLPVVTKVFTFPFGTKISHVDVSFSNTKELTLTKKVQPAIEAFPVNIKVANEPFMDTAVYGSAVLYPTIGYRYTTRAGLDGTEHVIYLAVQCYPVRYSPANDMIYYSEYAEIQVTYEEPANPTVFSDQYNLVIISPSEFSNELQPLIDHKISMGVNTILKTTEEIYSEYSGWDQAEKIKYFIKDAIETFGVDYVLLVGSIDKLPIRTTWFFERHHENYWNETVLTDLYYADIYDTNGDFCSWDSDGDGVYGESYQDCPGVNDIVDLYADVNIGRLPCEKKNEVNTVVDKIIHYETDTYGKSWFDNIILVGGDTFPGHNGNEGEQKNQITEQIMSDFVPTHLWTSDGTFSARTLNQALNGGAGFIDYSGHGVETGMGTHPPNSDTWVSYNNANLLGALNGYKLPILFFDACLTSKLDFNVSQLLGSMNYESESVPVSSLYPFLKAYNSGSILGVLHSKLALSDKLIPCFAWNWVKKNNGGAIATIGATRTAYGDLTMGCGYLSLQYYRAYASSETVSQMLTKAQNDYLNTLWEDYFTVEEFILIGDPSLKIGGYQVDDSSSSISQSQQSQSNPQGNPSPNQQSNPIAQQINQFLQRAKITNI